MVEANVLRHLRALLAVVENGSVARAAEGLFRTPAAVSSSIKRLESHLGGVLFERQLAGMRVTECGEMVYRRAFRIRSELRTASEELLSFGVDQSAPVLNMLMGERHFAVLAKLADVGHMPTVATVLGMSQPAVSTILRETEASLGVALFRRTPKGVSITEPGEILVFRLRRCLAELRHLDADMVRWQGTEGGAVTFAALPSLRTRVLPQAICTLTEQYPNVQLSLVDAPFEILLAGLRSGDIDFIFTGLSKSDRASREFHVEIVGEDILVAIVGAHHPIRQKRSLQLEDLLAYPWVLRNRGAPSRELLHRLFVARGLPQPRVISQTGDLHLLRGLLIDSDVITMVSPEHLAFELQAGVVVQLPLELPETARKVGFISRRDAHPSNLCQQFMQVIAREARTRFIPE